MVLIAGPSIVTYTGFGLPMSEREDMPVVIVESGWRQALETNPLLGDIPGIKNPPADGGRRAGD